MKNPLLDAEFLRALDSNRNRTVYAKIISLNQYEYPIEQIEGVVTAGSISIDGESAVRRVCQLTLSAKNLNINNVYWGLTTKVKIEIGLENTINSSYEDIIWFKQGLFILTDFKTSQTTNNYTINLTGKDKMCLLNGDIAGTFSGPIRFDTFTTESNDHVIIDETGSFNLYEQKVNDSNVINSSNLSFDNFSYNYGKQLNKITSLTYLPISPISITGTLTLYLRHWTKVDQDDILKYTQTYNLKDIIKKIDNSNEYVIDLDTTSFYGFIVEGCTPGDEFKWGFDSKVPINTLITSLMHQYGQERLSNIVIKDIDPFALEMVDSYDNNPYYLIYNVYSDYLFLTKTELIDQFILANGNEIDLETFIFNTATDEDNFNLLTLPCTTIIKRQDKNADIKQIWLASQINQGEVAGYRMTPLVYPDDLIAQAGETITSVLDKIVKVLGQYEYFYNLEGQFIFQAKPAYISIPWNSTVTLVDDNYVDPGEISKRVGYIFDSADLTTQYTNTPRMDNVKNDYIIWGQRKVGGTTIPIHARYAIDNPPVEYTDFNGKTWCTNKTVSDKTNIKNEHGDIRQYALNRIVVDWRHLIYIMAEDWLNHNQEDDFDVRIRTNNNWPDLNINLFPFGKTGYEQYYEDLVGFWEELYNVGAIDELYHTGIISTINENYYDYSEESSLAFWNKMVIEDPTMLNFWFDFFKADEIGIGKFAVSVVGDRPKTINNSIIKVITYRDAPDIIYCTASEHEWYESIQAIKAGYHYIILDNNSEFYSSLVRSVRGRSAHQEAENMLYQYSYYNDTVNITAVPIYYLNPNTLISIKDELSNIIGYYVMTKINLSLTYNGTMSITAIKTPEKIY